MIIPEPKIYNRESDKCTSVKSCIYTEREEWKKYLDVFCKSFEKMNEGTSVKTAKGGIELIFSPEIRADGYKLDTTDGIKIYASSDEGILYGITSALQLITAENGKLVAPEAKIEDYPDKEYRGLMVDIAYGWRPARYIYKYIDVCFLYKIKYLHLHFIDNNGYSLPSKAYPKISTKGRHYTFEEVKAFNEYAIARGVCIIPEFEAPGHARSLNVGYPEIFRNKLEAKGNTVYSEIGAAITDENIICAGSAEAMTAIETLISEIAGMFPNSPYIHIGGDEANINIWPLCSECKKYMKENGIEDEYELYSDFIGRVSRAVLKTGKTPIVWEGFPKKGAERVPRETIVVAWESHYHLVNDLLDEGFKVINCSWQPLYIVNSLSKRWNARDILKWNVYNWQHWWEKSEATLNPINVTPTDKVLGAEICAWVYSYETEIPFIMENLAALSERTWNLRRRHGEKETISKIQRVILKAAKLIRDTE